MLGQVEAQIAAAAQFAKKHGGVSGGEENGRAGYNVTMAIACTSISCSSIHRNESCRHHSLGSWISFTASRSSDVWSADIADFMAEHGIQGETFETCCNWDCIDYVIEAAKMEAKVQHKKHGLIGAFGLGLDASC